MPKEFKFRGKSFDELSSMQHAELAELLDSRARRSLKRGLTDVQKKLLEKIKKMKEGKRKGVKTQSRDMVILPEMVGVRIGIHNGKEYVQVEITEGMIGHYLGEFVRTRKDPEHKAPGIGATRGTKHVSVK